MVTLWRLVKTRFAATAFDGEGARLFGGRWSSPGTRVAYASNSAALAILEVLVHLESNQILSAYSLISARVPEDLIDDLPVKTLPSNWKTYPPPAETAAIGDAWVKSGASAVLKVPSVLTESEFNFLLNPAHPRFSRIAFSDPAPYAFDKRLRK